ncbi:uncharacterized protein LOC111902585 [Lactuca sativa]|uniref:uncharacterized protein LOC111902585 n=1 Tax=Lactuca sativa TaxID=4236 RepID=UPI001C68D74B|nr:uncharacterized protein LOC111902585 [Lactuca sativa]
MLYILVPCFIVYLMTNNVIFKYIYQSIEDKVTITKTPQLTFRLTKMAAASRFSIRSQTKSISLPSRSHPTTLRIEELLNKIKATTASTETICSGLSQLTGLYECMDELLTSSTTHVLMSRQQNKKWVDELMEESVMLLDVCGNIRDILSEIKGHTRDLLCALRRRKGDLNIQNSITKYNCFRKKMIKDVRKLVASLKQFDNVTTGDSVVVDSDNHQLAATIKAVLGVVEMTISVFNSFLMFLSVPILKANRWSFVVSKLIHKGIVACETQQEHGILNELESVDSALQRLCKHGSLSGEGGNVEIAQCRLQRLGVQIENMESGFEYMFRCLIRTRASLLNIENMHMH